MGSGNQLSLWLEGVQSPQREEYEKRMRRTATLAGFGSGALMIGSYPFYLLLREGYYSVSATAPPAYPVFLPYLVVSVCGAGFCGWIAALWVLRRAMGTLEEMDEYRFNRAARFPTIGADLLCLVMLSLVLAVFFLTTSPLSVLAAKGSSPISSSFQIGITCLVVLGIFATEIVAIGGLAYRRRLASLPGRRALTLVAVMSLVSSLPMFFAILANLK